MSSSHFPLLWLKSPDKSSLGGTRVNFSSQGDPVHQDGGGDGGGDPVHQDGGGWSTALCQQGNNGCTHAPAQLPVFTQIPDHTQAAATSINITKTIPHRRAHRPTWAKQSATGTLFPGDRRLYQVDKTSHMDRWKIYKTLKSGMKRQIFPQNLLILKRW